MQQIRIAVNGNGSHDNQTVHGEVLDGYAVIPGMLDGVLTTEIRDGAEIVTLENYPFGEVTVEDVNGVPTVTSWTPLPLPPTVLGTVRTAKLAELSNACAAAITAGCDVALSAVSGHISLTAEDQINLSTATSAVEQGAAGYPYHLDGQLCAIFPAEDIRTMARAATAHKLYHTTYYNHLAAWVRRCETAEELEAITYGADLPADLAANMAAILAAAEGGANV